MPNSSAACAAKISPLACCIPVRPLAQGLLALRLSGQSSVSLWFCLTYQPRHVGGILCAENRFHFSDRSSQSMTLNQRNHRTFSERGAWRLFNSSTVVITDIAFTHHINVGIAYHSFTRWIERYYRKIPARLTARQINRQPALRCLFIFFMHIKTCLAHRLDTIIKRDEMCAIPAQCQRCR